MSDAPLPIASVLQDRPSTLDDVPAMLSPTETSVQQLLDDISILRKWQRTTKPTHQMRDAMLKLASCYAVLRKTQGKHRLPAEVAEDIEESMLERATHLLAQSNASSVDASVPKIARKASPPSDLGALRSFSTLASAVFELALYVSSDSRAKDFA